MKSRRVILTIEVETGYSLAALRSDLTHIALSCGRWIVRYPSPDSIHDETPERIVQVQANAIRPEPIPMKDLQRKCARSIKAKRDKAQRERMAQFAKDDAERADPKRPGWFLDRVAEVQSKPERKAKRDKGAK